MKILWIVNTLFPAPSLELGVPIPVVGGWMYGLAEQLSLETGIEIAIATTSSVFEFTHLKVNGIKYYILPCKDNNKYDSKLEDFWAKLCLDFKPDIVHIHGTEFSHGLTCMRINPNLKYVVSIQGLVSVIERYYSLGMSFMDIFQNITFRDILRLDTIWQQKLKIKKRGINEKEYLKKTKHIIGRTSWDEAHVTIINPDVNYHFCNESLRNGFYEANKWSFEKCKKQTIFLSQASYPIKGLHQVIKAVSLLKFEYPEIKVKIGGAKITTSKLLKDRLMLSGYGKYIKRLIRDKGLENNIEFLGCLSEQKMIREYKNANVFICPSSIENSPNSIGEAQILGVPTIAAYVGGVPDMIENRITGLIYRFEEIEVLAENIRCVFNDSFLALQLSKNGIKTASLRHDRKINLESTLLIYNSINESN